jgi:hypothetical protein
LTGFKQAIAIDISLKLSRHLMNIYKAYNLCIHSELPLPELIEAAGKPDVIVRYGIEEDGDFEHDGGNRCRAQLEEVGEFLISAGREILVNPLPDVEASLLRAVLLGPILCVLLRQRGLLVLHASCVEIEGQGIAFLGGSGWGKSTLAAAFQSQGHRILTDDVMPIDLSTGCPLVFPSYPQGKLWPEAATFLGHDSQSLAPIAQHSFKLAYRFTDSFQSSPLPLQRIYVLAKGEAHQIEPLQPQEAFVELVRHTRVMQFMKHSDIMAFHLQRCTELIRQTSFCRFTRKPDLADLSKLVRLVEDNLPQPSDQYSSLVSSQ